VGVYPKGISPYGAYDMAGNVWEWVADWYDENYYASSLDASPTDPESGEVRVLPTATGTIRRTPASTSGFVAPAHPDPEFLVSASEASSRPKGVLKREFSK
jgi:formylglycine-generating enzyme required for sulfatase activity